MNPKGLGAVALVLCLAVAAVLLWNAADRHADSTPTVTEGVDATGAVERDAENAAAPVGTDTNEGGAIDGAHARETISAAADSATLARFKGRVVDTSAAPLAGAVVSLRTWRRSRAEMEEYVRQHGEAEFVGPEAIRTGPDGVFEIAFAPIPPLGFAIDVKCEGYVELQRHWTRLEPGTTEDFGDIELFGGVEVTGQLVDREGNLVRPPTEAVYVALRATGGARSDPADFAPHRLPITQVRPDGTFTFEQPIEAGLSAPQLLGLELDGTDQQMKIEAPRTDIRIVVHRRDELLRASGVVVDEAGQPISNVKITTPGLPNPSSRANHTTRDGRFEIVRTPDFAPADHRFTIRAARAGFHETTGEKDFGFGEHDIRIVMPRIPAMEVLVVRADDNSPVEDYGLRVLRGNGGGSTLEYRVIDGWMHSDGLTHVTTIKHRGDHRVCVEPGKSTGLGWAMQSVHVDLHAPPRVTLALPTSVVQPVVLRTADGRPIAGSEVELVAPFGKPLTTDSFVVEFSSGDHSSNPSGILLDRAVTDSEGRCSLTGPAGTPVTIRCRGEHVPVVEPSVTLTESPLHLTAPAGATLIVRVEPLEALAGWRRLAGLAEQPDGEEGEGRYAPNVRLHRVVNSQRESFPPGGPSGVPLTTEGAVLTGVPPGTWQIQCNWYSTTKTAGSGTVSLSQSMEAPSDVILAADQTKEVVLDATAYLTGTVSGRLLIDGEPPRDGVMLAIVRTRSQLETNGRPARDRIYTNPGDDGTFEVALYPGTWNGEVSLVHGSTRYTLFTTPPISITAGQHTDVVLNAVRARAEIRVLDPSGAAAAGIEMIASADPRQSGIVLTTDANGVVTLFGTPGTYSLRTRVRSLNSQSSYWEALKRKQHESGGDLKSATIAIGLVDISLPDIELTPESSREAAPPIEVRLPPEWDR